jgi:hypothetical protein
MSAPTKPDRRHRRFDRTVGRDDDDGRPGIPLPDLLHQRHAVAVGKPEVAQHRIGPVAPDGVAGFFKGGGMPDRHPRLLQVPQIDPREAQGIFDHQYQTRIQQIQPPRRSAVVKG